MDEIKRSAGGWDSLSSAEIRVLEHVCEGLTNPQIGERLFLSRRTVQSHLYSMFRKVGVQSRTELAARAVSDGVVRPHAQRMDPGQ